MSSKSLARTGLSLFNRFLNPNSTHNLISQTSEISPNLFPTLSKFQTSLRFQPNNKNDEFVKRSDIDLFLHPCGFPSLQFFLPEGLSQSSLANRTINERNQKVAGGIWAHTVGGKYVLGFVVIWWSIATALTPIAAKFGLPFLLVVRAFMGIGEAHSAPLEDPQLSSDA
ncbi:hypothetical protein IFM89_003989 [Coptis chinensis]|uniref:Uncharacterized protein n=1 Tax=Coptis chinensis TaxID=261450 RepID=A0A835HYE4_9MAGN|nr:hypothetical protein IFM89_003989 [Coptis chinensis]